MVCQPVTTYKTSYYCEPVCSYRVSCYFDPCTCKSIQVTTPVTTYRLRSRCDAVTSYVQRCVPVTAYRPTFYLEAVTTCAPPPPCPNPCGPGGGIGGGIHENPPAGNGNYIGPQNVPMGVEENPPAGSGATPGSLRQPAPNRAVPFDPTIRPSLKLDHVVSRPVPGTSVNGQVVANNSIFPVGGAKLVFVSRQGGADQQSVTTDNAGRFQVQLPSGGWSIYVSRPDGMLEYHSSLAVRENESRNVRVVSR
jgi:hypothetical protein